MLIIIALRVFRTPRYYPSPPRKDISYSLHNAIQLSTISQREPSHLSPARLWLFASLLRVLKSIECQCIIQSSLFQVVYFSTTAQQPWKLHCIPWHAPCFSFFATLSVICSLAIYTAPVSQCLMRPAPILNTLKPTFGTVQVSTKFRKSKTTLKHFHK